MLELRLSPESLPALATLAASGGGLAFILGLYALVSWYRAQRTGNRPAIGAGITIFAVLLGLQVLVWQLYSQSETHTTVTLWGVALALFVSAGTRRVGMLLTAPQRPHVPKALPILLGILSVVQVFGFVRAFELLIAPHAETSISQREFPLEDAEYVAITDKGRIIELKHRQVPEALRNEYMRSLEEEVRTISARAMLREELDINSNCHGWVFSESKFIVTSDAVQTILEDNGYVQVNRPRLNDVVVYRDNAGKIIHTGLVRGFFNRTSVLVESKWGANATFVHLAEEQPYSMNIAYYRSTRGTHALRIVPRDSATENDSLLMHTSGLNSTSNATTISASLPNESMSAQPRKQLLTEVVDAVQ